MLTPTMKKVLDFVVGYARANEGITPTYDEMRAHVGATGKSGVHRTVDQLVRRGFLERGPGAARNLRVVRLPEVPGSAAMEVERERCALIADDAARGHDARGRPFEANACREIAAAIRSVAPGPRSV